MKLKIIIIALFLLQSIFQYAAAQNNALNFHKVDGVNGKPLGKIVAITQDPHGYMWFAGQTEKCIYRYDGSRMISYKHDNANPNSLWGTGVETMYADSKGIIWIGYGGDGLDRFNPTTGVFKHYPNLSNDSGKMASSVVSVIVGDHQGRLWFGTNNGLYRLDERTGQFINYKHEPGNERSLSSNIVRSIYEDRKGVIWIGTGLPFFQPDQPNDDGGLNRLMPDGSFTRYLHDPKNPHSLINNKIRAIFEDSHGVFWVGTSGDGLHTMDRENGSFERHLYNPAKPDGLSRPKPKHAADHITFITEDSTGAIWIGTYAAGLNRYNPVTKKVIHYQSGNGFPDSTSWNGFISRDGVLWVSTEQSELLFRVALFPKSINSVFTGNHPNDFMEDKEGNLWVSTEGNGLYVFDEHQNLLHQFKHNPSDSFSILANDVSRLFVDKENNFWVGTYSGVRIFNKVTQKFSRFGDGGNLKDSNHVGFAKIFQDKQGFMWFGRWGGGLVCYNPKDQSFRHFLLDEKDSSSIGSNFVNSILEDRSGALWVAGAGGINRLNRETGRFKHYLEGNFIYYLYEDSRGLLWAGTQQGLFSYNQKDDRFTSFFEPWAEINRTNVGGIVEDNSKNLWLTSPSAIIKLNPLTKETLIYSSSFGIKANSLSPWVPSYKTHKGQILIAYDEGFYIFHPIELAVDTTSSKIILTDFFINNLPVLPGKESPLQKPVEEISDLFLKYNQNNIAFNYTAIDYREPEATKYFTMLEKYDNTWREAIGEKSSYYFNISPGDYVFRIRAYNMEGIKIEKAIAIRIYPPWWGTWWFRVTAALLLVALFYGIIRWRLHRKFQTKLERSEKEKQLAELQQQKAELEMQALRAQMNPHFIFNSLNSINRFILQNNKLQASEYLTKFSRLVRLILQNSQAPLIPLESELEALHLYLELEAVRFEHHFDYTITVANDIDSSLVKVPPLIIQPYAENAIWHGLMHKQTKGHLGIQVIEQEDLLLCKITDDGVGRQKAAELKSKSAPSHKSMGMRITADRIAMLQQKKQLDEHIKITDLVLADGNAGGTEVLIKMPLIYENNQ